ncbi:MAG: homoserine O-succinyltransferase [Sporolactobacillus sp.]
MPIKIPNKLPARKILESENIFVMDENRARSQDIRALNILILNLMPEKEREEAQLLRLLGNTPLQVNVTFFHTATHEAKHASALHLEQFYSVFNEIRHRKYDGLIITGAPVEKYPFESVDYWKELQSIMEWAKTAVTSTLYICWAAQAALYHHFNIGKIMLPHKLSGIYQHRLLEKNEKLLRGFDDTFAAPHSRYTGIDERALAQSSQVQVLASSEEAGPFILMANGGKQIMATGHFEYDVNTLGLEYERDLAKGIHPFLPDHYYPGNDRTLLPVNTWRAHAHLFFSNWLNYYVYQETPYRWQ